MSDGRFDFFVGDVAYLTGPPLHVHEAQEDTFYVLEGTLTVQSGDEVFDVGPGDFVTFPPGVAHTFDNTRKDQPRVKVINIMTPGGCDQAILAFNRLGSHVAELEQAQAIGEPFGVAFIGPTLREKLGLG